MKFSENFLSYPNFKNEGDFSSLNFRNNDKYIRHVKICCKKKKLFIHMNKNGNVELSEEPSMWDVIIVDNEMTLFSNGYYLDVIKRKTEDKDKFGEELCGCVYMIIWNFKTIKNYYIFYYPKKENENTLRIRKTLHQLNFALTFCLISNLNYFYFFPNSPKFNFVLILHFKILSKKSYK